MFAGSYRLAKRPIQQLASDLFGLDISLGMIPKLGEWVSRFVERVLSVTATCRQQGRNVLEYLTSCFHTRVTDDPLPSLLACSAVINSP